MTQDEENAITELRVKIEALREVMITRFEADERARDIAYKELERRLTDLNHAHANMLKDRTEFLRQDVYERSYAEYREWSRKVDNALSTQTGRSAAYVTILGFLFVALQIFLKYWH